jgi:hypothetical protein
MSAKVPTIVQSAGDIPAVRVSYYTDNKVPAIALSAGQRLSKLYYKTNKETNTLRSSMAVILNQVAVRAIQSCERGQELLQALVDELQDAAAKRVADKSAPWELVEDAERLVKDYFDTSRTASGKKVSAQDVGTFFDTFLTEFLVGRIVAKFPQFATDKVAKVVEQHKQAFCDLAKYSLPHGKGVTEILAKDWNEYTKEETFEATDMSDWIGERIKKLQDRHNAEEMLTEAI